MLSAWLITDPGVSGDVIQHMYNCEQQQKVRRQWTTWYDRLRSVQVARAECASILIYTSIFCAF